LKFKRPGRDFQAALTEHSDLNSGYRSDNPV